MARGNSIQRGRFTIREISFLWGLGFLGNPITEVKCDLGSWPYTMHQLSHRLETAMDSSCGEEKLSPLVHHRSCSLSKQLKNGSTWSSYSSHRNPWKGKGQHHPLPTPFYRRDARHCTVVVPQRPLVYYYSRKADVFPLALVNKRPQSVRRRGEDVSPVRAEQQAFPRVPRNTIRYTR
ncbi:uncharacterized protein LOC113562701 [Ooceraea biroi]|uniref:uncharacterized protein LOC113562701 n=1 Tax=Ooceraea biroi TaxID=2015173 RepID=UPI000F0773C1|nr:uncharacterized protein LOC113562701 [Ooceraea biroi]